MAKTTRAPSRLRQRRIVERPRLRRLLDDAAPRVRMLIAPAGFGKTTLAEQWADSPGRRSAWYRARSSSRDVAVLATGLSDAAATVLPGCDARFRERLSVTGNPSDEAHVLAEMLAEDLSGWPDDAWLVLDDHHNFDGAAASELFLATLVRQAPVNVLLTSRDRPAWVSSRDLLYGSVFELSQSALAMTQEEASDVLVDWDRSRASGLIALADGWPAVIGLAGIAPDAAEPDAAPPAELYAYFAEEVLQALGDDVRDGLSVLAIPPVLDAQIATALLGQERARRVCAEGLAAGILVDRGGRLDVHPLAVQYVRANGTFGADGAAIDAAVAQYATRRDWEAASELVQRTRASDSMGPLLEDALPELLASAHLGTIEAWIARMSEALPVVRIARAELDLREGRLAPAETLALGVSGDAANDSALRRRAAIVAGRAAHLASRESEGAMYFELAETLATDEPERREAAWGRIMCAAALETPEARTLLDELRASSANSDPLEVVRMADKDLAVSFHAGRIEGLTDARRAAELLDHVTDPMARCSFRSMFAGALNLTCDYTEGVAVAEEMAEDASAFRVDFAIPHAFSAMAAGLIGLHDYRAAHAALDRSELEARRRNDGFGILNAYSNRMRCLTQEQRADEACAIELPDTSSSVRGIAAEGRCSRALALACNNRLDEAAALVADIRNVTLSVEPLALAYVVEAVIAVRRRSSDLASRLEIAVDQAFETGAIDMLVCGYRSSPDLFGALLAHPATRERTLFAVARAADEALVPDDDNPPTYTTPLTRREREVHSLICEGLSNAEIASILFLSEGTVKVHVHHIFDKLGIRNRAALIMLAAAERNRQATPASRGSSTDGSSSALD